MIVVSRSTGQDSRNNPAVLGCRNGVFLHFLGPINGLLCYHVKVPRLVKKTTVREGDGVRNCCRLEYERSFRSLEYAFSLFSLQDADNLQSFRPPCYTFSSLHRILYEHSGRDRRQPVKPSSFHAKLPLQACNKKAMTQSRTRVHCGCPHGPTYDMPLLIREDPGQYLLCFAVLHLNIPFCVR